jgi:rubredoxin-NAD+ reductase
MNGTIMTSFSVWECIVCGWIYDESQGFPEDGIAPGTLWDDIPQDWSCPDCGVTKQDFEMVKTGLSAIATKVATPEEKPRQPKGLPEAVPVADNSGEPFQIWECVICGWVYDESKGWPDDDILAGTRWADIPDDWTCPDCGVGKQDFDMISVSAQSREPATASLQESPEAIEHSQAPIVIIGTGLAGYNLAREYRKLNSITPLVMITSDDGRMYYKPAISTGYHKQKTADQLATANAGEMALQLQADIQVYTNIENIDIDNKSVLTSKGPVQYSKLILATGARCIELPMAGNGLDAVYSINNLLDYATFRDAMKGKNHVLIIGGGLIGSEYANDLIQSGYEVSVVDPLPSVLGTLMPKPASDSVKNALEAAGVNFYFGTVVEQINKQAAGVQATLANGQSIDADIVLSAVGVRPDLTLAKSAGLQTNRGIITNRSLQTSAQNIYALGDCAEVDSHLLFYVAPLIEGAKKLAATLNGDVQDVYYGTMPVVVKTTLFPVTLSPPPKVEGQWQIEVNTTAGVKALFKTAKGQLLGYALTGDCTPFRKELDLLMQPIMLG